MAEEKLEVKSEMNTEPTTIQAEAVTEREMKMLLSENGKYNIYIKVYNYLTINIFTSTKRKNQTCPHRQT
jgi:uncharacterized membrane protein